jgi:hypothetical protein
MRLRRKMDVKIFGLGPREAALGGLAAAHILMKK